MSVQVKPNETQQMQDLTSNPVLAQIHNHYSVRSFDDRPVSDEQIKMIVAAGQAAPSTCFRQVYSVIAVKDHQMKKDLRAVCGGQRWVEECPVFLVFCADLNRLETICQARGADVNLEHTETFLSSAIDVALVMQNSALAAESMGLGMVMIGGVRDFPREVIKLLNLPRGVFALVGMCIGYPSAEALAVRPATPKPRLPLEEVLYWETYDKTGREDRLAAYDVEIKEYGAYHTKEGKPNGWTNVMGRTTSKPPPETGRLEMKQILNEQGFEMQ